MRALMFDEFGGPLTVRDRAEPIAPDGGVVVHVHATGLCRSDWHGWLGHDPDVAALPHVPGHEFAGVVGAVGDGVDPAWLGQLVTAPFVYACGACEVCRAGDGQVCPHQLQPGGALPGSFAEQVVVTGAATNLVPLPDGLDPALAAGLGCRVATAYRGLTARAGVQPGEWVAVLGCGGVGLASIAIAQSRGARVVAVDVDPAALSRARALGASATVTAGAGVDVPAAVHDATGGGAHVAVEALGSPDTCRDAVLALRRRGRLVQVGLLADGMASVPMGRVIGWELDVLGSHGMAAADYAALLDDVQGGRLDLGSLLAPGPALTLDGAAEALPALSHSSPHGIRIIDPRL